MQLVSKRRLHGRRLKRVADRHRFPLPVGDLLSARHMLFDDVGRVCRVRRYAEYATSCNYWEQQARLKSATAAKSHVAGSGIGMP